MNDESRLYTWFGITGVICLVTLAISPAKDYFREWKGYQNAFYKKLSSPLPVGIRQLAVVELGKVDRCVTCHTAVEDPGFTDEEEPFRYHSRPNLHPFEKFGCSVCHEGQGRATTLKDAHGHGKHWEKPMLPLDYIQASCGKCHFEGELEGAPLLVQGRGLYKEK